MDVLLCSDANNAWGLAVTVRTLLDSISGKVKIHILDLGLGDENIDKLTTSWKSPALESLEFHTFDKALVQQFRSTRYLRSKSTYARLLCGSFLPESVEKCLYLDTDLLIYSDIRELYETDLAGNIAAASKDICIRGNELTGEDSRASEIARHKENLHLSSPEKYFNAGVILLDLKKWRAEDIESSALRVGLEMYDVLDCQDQDILNVVLEGRWQLLDPKWNRSQYEVAEGQESGIIHLIGTTKPWHSDYDYRFYAYFYEILDKTEYANSRPKNYLRIAPFLKKLERKVPTFEMIVGKGRRNLERIIE